MGRYEQGMEVRRQVLGDAHVDSAVETTDSIDADFQTWITEAVWGSVWSRPGLDPRTRSLVTIALLAAQGRPELALHLRSAANTGATVAEIAETLFHVGVYAGVPAAHSAFDLLKEIAGEGGHVAD